MNASVENSAPVAQNRSPASGRNPSAAMIVTDDAIDAMGSTFAIAGEIGSGATDARIGSPPSPAQRPASSPLGEARPLPDSKDAIHDDLLVRPAGYHPVLPWPPALLVERVRQVGNDGVRRQKLREEIERHCSFVRRQIEKVDRRFRESDSDRVRMSDRMRDRLRRNGHDEEAIRAAQVTMIASLFLNPQGVSPAFAESAHFISRNRVRTFDGAKLTYTDQGVKVNRMTEQAIALLLEEAKARKWKSIEVRGPAAFRKAVIQAARRQAMDIPIHETGLLVRRTRWARRPTHIPAPNGAADAPETSRDDAVKKADPARKDVQPAPGLETGSDRITGAPGLAENESLGAGEAGRIHRGPRVARSDPDGPSISP